MRLNIRLRIGQDNVLTQVPISELQLVRQRRRLHCWDEEGRCNAIPQNLDRSQLVNHIVPLMKEVHTVPGDDFHKLRGGLKDLIPAGVPQPVGVEDLVL
jgi:hypothetical protein